ncbi:acyl carrier protein [Parapedomonas caeni]
MSERAQAIEAQLKALLDEALGLGGRAAAFTRQTALLGALPELDSMAIATVLAHLEERFGILIDDEDISAEVFETVGSLADFVGAKVAA